MAAAVSETGVGGSPLRQPDHRESRYAGRSNAGEAYSGVRQGCGGCGSETGGAGDTSADGHDTTWPWRSQTRIRDDGKQTESKGCDQRRHEAGGKNASQIKSSESEKECAQGG